VTWIRVEKPSFDLVGVILSSLELTVVILAAAVLLGTLLGVSLIVRRRRLALPPDHSLSVGLVPPPS
jgi:hypothetical protein